MQQSDRAFAWLAVPDRDLINKPTEVSYMRKTILAALVATTFAAPAFAQEAGPFTGFRVEGIAGYGQLGTGEDPDEGVENDDQRDEAIEGAVFGVGRL